MNMHKGSCVLGLKHGDNASLDFTGTRMNRSDLAGPVFNPDIASGIKQEVDSDYTETGDSKGLEFAEQDLCKRVTPFISELKVNEIHCIDAEGFGSTVISISGKPEAAGIKEDIVLLEQFNGQNSYRNVNFENRIPSGNEGNLSEYRLDRISIYETGFCVISDPIVPQGELPVSIPYPLPKAKRGRPSGRTKRHECNECGKCFNDGARLQVHERIHTGERPFQCPTCEKSFMDKYRLDNHIMIHTGEKPHKCKICNRCFNQRPTLRRHLRTHE